jgi:hypothetical protein
MTPPRQHPTPFSGWTIACAALLAAAGCGVDTATPAGDQTASGESAIAVEQVKASLYAFKRTPGFEVHALAGNAWFQRFTVQSTTPLGDTGTDEHWVFRVGDWNDDGHPDVFAIKRSATGSHRTEVHVLDGASGCHEFLLQVATALEETGTDDAWDFDLGDFNRDGRLDLFAIAKSHTGTHSTEVHILDGATNFKTWLLHTGTPLGETGTDGRWSFAVGDFDGDGHPDLYIVNHGVPGQDAQTDVHVLSGADGYQGWLVHTRSPLGVVGTGLAWEFRAADYDADGRAELFVVKKQATGTGNTELHVLDPKTSFSTWLLHTNTALAETGSNGVWRFAVYAPRAAPSHPLPPPQGSVDVPASLVSLLSPRPYVEQSCNATSYPGWPHAAQRCTYSSGGITTSVTVANPSADRAARWVVDSATFIPALARLKGSAQAQYEEGLRAIGLAMLYQSSRIYPLSGGIIEDMGGGYVNYDFENGVTRTCSSGCYCRINSLHRNEWCDYQAGIGRQSRAACLAQVGSSGYTAGWASECFENHKRSFSSDVNEHFRAKAFVANFTVASRCPGSTCSPAQVVAAVRSAYGL